MIDADTGNIHLPNGFVITPTLTLDTFQQSWLGRNAIVHRPTDSQEQCWFEVDAGDLNLHSAFVSLVFCKQRLVNLDLQLIATCYFGDVPRDYFAVEHNTKSFHDDLLRRDLDEANCFTRTNCDEPGLDKAPNYALHWGKIISGFDYGAGNAYISVEYSNDKAL